MKIVTIIIITIFTGCTGIGDISKRTNYAYSGEIQGDHFILARCVIDTMKKDKKWKINSLKYKIKADPNKMKTRIIADGINFFGTFNAFTMELNKISPLASKIKLTGVKLESEKALRNLKKCAENN